MKSSLMNALMIATLGVCIDAAAIEPYACVSRVNLPDGGMALKNGCDKKVEVSYCVKDNPKSSNRCRPGTLGNGGGAATISPALQVGIPDFKLEGGGNVQYAACFHPNTPVDWDVNRKTWTCR